MSFVCPICEDTFPLSEGRTFSCLCVTCLSCLEDTKNLLKERNDVLSCGQCNESYRKTAIPLPINLFFKNSYEISKWIKSYQKWKASIEKIIEEKYENPISPDETLAPMRDLYNTCQQYINNINKLIELDKNIISTFYNLLKNNLDESLSIYLTELTNILENIYIPNKMDITINPVPNGYRLLNNDSNIIIINNIKYTITNDGLKNVSDIVSDYRCGQNKNLKEVIMIKISTNEIVHSIPYNKYYGGSRSNDQYTFFIKDIDLNCKIITLTPTAKYEVDVPYYVRINCDRATMHKDDVFFTRKYNKNYYDVWWFNSNGFKKRVKCIRKNFNKVICFDDFYVLLYYNYIEILKYD